MEIGPTQLKKPDERLHLASLQILASIGANVPLLWCHRPSRLSSLCLILSKKANIAQVLYPKSEAEERTTHFSNSLPSLNPIAGGSFLGVCINQCHPNTPGSLFTEDALALAVWTVMNGVDTGRKRGEGPSSITESREQKEISKPWAIQATSRKDFSTQGFINHGSQGHTILWRLNVHSFLFLP